jgi:hypothetical protein
MDKPKRQPSADLIDLVKVGPIRSLAYDRKKSQASKAEAESEAHGHYDYDCSIQVQGLMVGDVCTETTIFESTFLEFVEVGTDINEYGFWRVTVEGHALVSDWEKWMKAEAKDVREYKRLKEKFGGVLD